MRRNRRDPRAACPHVTFNLWFPSRTSAELRDELHCHRGPCPDPFWSKPANAGSIGMIPQNGSPRMVWCRDVRRTRRPDARAHHALLRVAHPPSRFAPRASWARLIGSAEYTRTGMKAKRSGTGSEANITKERFGESAAPGTEPTHCDLCGKSLGMWFSLDNKAYCSPCFHSHFWTPFQSVPGKAH